VPTPPTATFPVNVVMTRVRVGKGMWETTEFQASAVIAGAHAAAAQDAAPVAMTSDGAQWLWPGFAVCLYRDSAESYWYNVVGQKPSLFVVCRASEDGELQPCLVSANYDEAGAYMEADDTVFSVPMPPEIFRWLEEFVREHYRPRPSGKRKRKDWFEESEYGRGRRPDGSR